MSELNPELKRQLENAAERIGSPVDSLLFVLSCWGDFEMLSESHIDGGTLCWRLHDQAIRMYGSQARAQLDSWGIQSTLDIGKIVFGLAENGLILTTDQDDLDEFNNVFSFDAEFSDFKNPQVTPSRQWKLSTLFLITALAAIAISGASQNGIAGIYAAFFSSWFVFIGFCCLVWGVSNRSRGWQFLVVLGVVSLAAGLFCFFTLRYWSQ